MCCAAGEEPKGTPSTYYCYMGVCHSTKDSTMRLRNVGGMIIAACKFALPIRNASANEEDHELYCVTTRRESIMYILTEDIVNYSIVSILLSTYLVRSRDVRRQRLKHTIYLSTLKRCDTPAPEGILIF